MQDASARDSLNTFVGGQGDVIISYENEIIGAQNAGEEMDLIVPDDTIRIDTIAVLPEGVDDSSQAFLDFLFTEEAQTLWAENGYRPVDEAVAKQFADEFPEPQGLFQIEQFVGWEQAAAEFFDPENGKIADIERELGVATE